MALVWICKITDAFEHTTSIIPMIFRYFGAIPNRRQTYVTEKHVLGNSKRIQELRLTKI